MTDTITLTILEIPGLSTSANLADRRFTERGQITVDARRGKPVWLPEIAGYAFLDPNGIVYAADRGGTPTRASSLVEEVFGSSIGKRFGQTGYIGFRFATEHPKILAACIEDDTTVDLPLDKALSLLKRDQRLYLARENLAYAVREAVARIGRPHRGDPADLTLRQIFGTIS